MLRTEIVTVPASWGARDAGKMFRITEMPALRAEKWAWRLFLAVKGTSGQVPDSLAPLGMVAVGLRGINAFLASDVEWEKLEPLLDEMLTCVGLVRDPTTKDPVNDGPLASAIMPETDIFEVKTLGWLRSEVVRIHTNFSFIEATLNWLATLPKDSTISTSPSG